ncbi:creatininase family protein [Tissierella praeacuta]|uniref:creatininase family protein n=1 Tax=Tissierella praeacuta TaxID=43131 RepID=UPI0028A5D06F|nr:creatininase family protein [Tissierella praeacuta]
MREIYLNKLNTRELWEGIENNTINKVILPFGSCESHGKHLPMGTDVFIPIEIAERIAREYEGTIIAPPVPFGTSINYNQYPMSINLRYETTIKLTEDILTSLIKYGLKNIIILNGHDANIPALEIAARNVKNKNKEATIIIVPGWWYYSRTILKDNYSTWDGKGHAGEAETSLMMAIDEKLVDLDRACCQVHNDVNELTQHGVMVIWDISEVTKTGTTGDSKSATLEKGQLLLNEFTKYLISLVKKLDNMDWKYDYKL